jgi:hypothetical protein
MNEIIGQCQRCQQALGACQCQALEEAVRAAQSLYPRLEAARPFPSPIPYPDSREQCSRCKYHYGDCVCHLHPLTDEEKYWISYECDLDG